jgi:hypothetical protein
MKKIVASLLGCLLLVSLAVTAEPTAADQKWLETVEKMVARGETRISTPSEARANLLKEWAGKSGYSAKVAKTNTGYSIEVGKSLVQK